MHLYDSKMALNLLGQELSSFRGIGKKTFQVKLKVYYNFKHCNKLEPHNNLISQEWKLTFKKQIQ